MNEPSPLPPIPFWVTALAGIVIGGFLGILIVYVIGGIIEEISLWKSLSFGAIGGFFAVLITGGGIFCLYLLGAGAWDETAGYFFCSMTVTAEILLVITNKSEIASGFMGTYLALTAVGWLSRTTLFVGTEAFSIVYITAILSAIGWLSALLIRLAMHQLNQ